MAVASYRLSTSRTQPRRGPAARQEVRSDLERRDRPTVQLCRRVLVARSRMSMFAFRPSRPARGGPRCHHVCKANPISGRLESPQAYLFNGFTEHTKKWQVTKRSQLESGRRTEDRGRRAVGIGAETASRNTHDAIRFTRCERRATRSCAKQSQFAGGPQMPTFIKVILHGSGRRDGHRKQGQANPASASPPSPRNRSKKVGPE